MTIEYKWREGSRINIPANVAARELARIAADNGSEMPPPSEVVRQSKPKDAPLHNYFEWNNTKAGALWRQHQARRITNSLKVVEHSSQKTDEGKIVCIKIENRAYTSIEKDDGSRAYVNTRVGLTHEEMRRKILISARLRLRSAQNELKELSDYIDFLDDLSAVIEKCGEAIKQYDAEESDDDRPTVD